MNKQQFCKRYNLTEDQFFGKEKIGGLLDLRSLTSIPEGFNPTVGGWLDLRSIDNALRKKVIKNTPPIVLSWKDYRYISVDGIFCEVISRKGMVYKCKKIGSADIFS